MTRSVSSAAHSTTTHPASVSSGYRTHPSHRTPGTWGPIVDLASRKREAKLIGTRRAAENELVSRYANGTPLIVANVVANHRAEFEAILAALGGKA